MKMYLLVRKTDEVAAFRKGRRKMKLLLQLFLIFAKMGAVTFGGGYAMLPILQREVVDNHHWATEEELMDYYALGQVTPGMIAVNVATFIGLKLKGFWGRHLCHHRRHYPFHDHHHGDCHVPHPV